MPRSKVDKTPHLLVCITAHGFGHAAQTAPVVNALRRLCPTLRLTLRTGLPREYLASRFEGDFDYVAEETDFGMAMANAMDVLVESSALRYADFHNNWQARVDREAKYLAALAPDHVLANIPYLTLAGAARTGIAATAMCSLNWADIYEGYCGHRSEASTLISEMRDAYNQSQCFLRIEPGMPMAWLQNHHTIAPVAQTARPCRTEIRSELGLAADERLVLIALGGIATRLPVERWPQFDRTTFLVPSNWGELSHSQIHPLETLRRPFIDVMAACDAMITKPGYGSFVEAACHGVPVLYAPRGDWPEEPYLIDWMGRHGQCTAVSRAQLDAGRFAPLLERLLTGETPAPARAGGEHQAARYLANALCPEGSVACQPGSTTARAPERRP